MTTPREPTAEHVPGLDIKPGSAYTTDDGLEVPEHALHRVYCACGWAGQVWYANPAKTVARWQEHMRSGGGES